MLKLLLLAGALVGGFLVYKRLTAVPEDDWDDDTMYGSAELHQNADATATPTGV